MGRKGQVAGHESHARLTGRVGDDEGSGILPLMQPFGDLVRVNEPQHRHADHRERNVRQRSADEIFSSAGSAAQPKARPQRSPQLSMHVTDTRARWHGYTAAYLM